MTDLCWMVLCFCGIWGLGAAISLMIAGPRLVEIPMSRFGFFVARAELIGLGWVLGIAGSSYLQFLWSLSGGQLGRGLSVVLSLSGIVLGAILLWRASVVAARNPSAELRQRDSSDGGSLARICAILVLALCASTLVQVTLTPQKLW